VVVGRVSFQQLATLALVLAAALFVAWNVLGAPLAGVLARALLKRGRVKWAMRLRAIAGAKGCH
jgi:hypothetical protein